MTEPVDRVAEARDGVRSSVIDAANGLWVSEQPLGDFEAAIREDERQRMASLCAWCGHEEHQHSPMPLGDRVTIVSWCEECEDTLSESDPRSAQCTYETTESALARLKRYEEALREIVSGAPWTGKPPYKWMQDRARAALADG